MELLKGVGEMLLERGGVVRRRRVATGGSKALGEGRRRAHGAEPRSATRTRRVSLRWQRKCDKPREQRAHSTVEPPAHATHAPRRRTSAALIGPRAACACASAPALQATHHARLRITPCSIRFLRVRTFPPPNTLPHAFMSVLLPHHPLPSPSPPPPPPPPWTFTPSTFSGVPKPRDGSILRAPSPPWRRSFSTAPMPSPPPSHPRATAPSRSNPIPALPPPPPPPPTNPPMQTPQLIHSKRPHLPVVAHAMP